MLILDRAHLDILPKDRATLVSLLQVKVFIENESTENWITKFKSSISLNSKCVLFFPRDMHHLYLEAK
jgi:hypothetical protein